MITATITSVDKSILQEDGSEFLDVAFDLKEEESLVDTKRLGFPLGTTTEEIVAEVEKYCGTFAADKQSAERNKERDTLHAQADKTIEDLVGREIASEVEPL